MREFLVYQDEDNAWVAECPKVPGLRVKAPTQAEAIEKIKHALLLYYPCRCED